MAVIATKGWKIPKDQPKLWAKHSRNRIEFDDRCEMNYFLFLNKMVFRQFSTFS